MKNKNILSKPTSKSWEKDAQSLLEMGAKFIDATTVEGLLLELKVLKKKLSNLKKKKND